MWRRRRWWWWVHDQATVSLSKEAKSWPPVLVLYCVKVPAFAVNVADVGVASKLFGNGASCYRPAFVVPTISFFSTVFMQDSSQEMYCRLIIYYRSGSGRRLEYCGSRLVVVNRSSCLFTDWILKKFCGSELPTRVYLCRLPSCQVQRDCRAITQADPNRQGYPLSNPLT